MQYISAESRYERTETNKRGKASLGHRERRDIPYSCLVSPKWHYGWWSNSPSLEAPAGRAIYTLLPNAGAGPHLGVGAMCLNTLLHPKTSFKSQDSVSLGNPFPQLLRGAPTCSRPGQPSFLLPKPTTSNRTSPTTILTNLHQPSQTTCEGALTPPLHWGPTLL